MSERASRYFCFKNNKGVCPSLLSGIFFLFKSRGVREGRLPEMERLYNVRARISYRLRLWHRDRALGLSYRLRLWHRDRALGQQTLDFDTLFLCR